MRASEFKKIQELTGLENKEVAEALHVSLSLVEKMRSGKRIITNHMAFVICEVLQNNKGKLFGYSFRLDEKEEEEIRSSVASFLKKKKGAAPE